MCSASLESSSGSGSSVTVKMRSNREMSAGSRSICSPIGSYWSKRPYFGFAAPRSEHRDLSVALMPALETDTLLFQRFVHRRTVFRRHLIEFVDGGDALICEHERAGLERPLLAVAEVVADGGRGEPRARRPFAGGVD